MTVSTLTDAAAERIILAAQELAITIRDESPDAVRRAAARLLSAAGGDPIAALAITGALVAVDAPIDPWWQRRGPHVAPVPDEPLRTGLRPCGTPSAYARHLAHDERPCEPCRLSHNEVRRERRHRQQTRAA